MTPEQENRLAWLEKKEANGLDESERIWLAEHRVPKPEPEAVPAEEITPKPE